MTAEQAELREARAEIERLRATVTEQAVVLHLQQATSAKSTYLKTLPWCYVDAMAMEIRQSELRNDNAAIMRRVAAGESFIVTVNGRPVADVVPHQRDTGHRRFVPVTDAIAALTTAPLSPQEAQRWWHDIRDGGDELSGPDVPEDPWERQAGQR